MPGIHSATPVSHQHYSVDLLQLPALAIEVENASSLGAGGRPVQTANKPISVSISIGLALSTEFTECTMEEVIHQADTVLYTAKAAGRNCVRVARPAGLGNRPKSSARKPRC